ncbi:alkaline phosphatase D [Balneicella halophila]|uniref:Alkaline phosphatase D n=1 Tax=Balneicella halophila TaxID=1537566 RepID=A0A7L4UR78_BALHA|nr:ectonucleotide pyrophosphatase/phosphodiesterase [Balneicella halophila]PVX50809.1 alkaline phosphatase D [Balneicella halophila]
MRTIITLLFICCSLSLWAQQPAGQYVVMVSLDGFRADYPEKFQAKNLLKIAKEGVRVQRMIPSNPTKTFPNHYSIVTGLYPDHHGLIGNAFYAPDLGKSYQVRDRKSVENGDFYGGEPIWNTARKAGLQTASYFWVGSEAQINKMQPQKWKKYNEKANFEVRIDSVISWLKLPHKERPRLITLYYHEPDKSGHHFGPDSPEVAEQVKYVDEQIGNLYKKLMQLPIADSINLIVLSDHGMRAISEEKQIILEDYIKEEWVQGIYGSNPVYTINAVEDKKDSIYKSLREVLHLKVYKRGKASCRWKVGKHIRTGDFFIVGEPGWSVFPSHKENRKFGGTHGYLNNDKQMHALFVAKGPAFKNGYTKRTIRNIDVYNLVAKILEIQPALNDGKYRRVRKMLKKNAR